MKAFGSDGTESGDRGIPTMYPEMCEMGTESIGRNLMFLSAQLTNRNGKIYVTGNCHNPWNYAEMDGLVVD